jgi:hypothetical protein
MIQRQVTFRLQAENLAHIKPLTASDVPDYGEVIRKTFASVAKEFGWTRVMVFLK